MKAIFLVVALSAAALAAPADEISRSRQFEGNLKIDLFGDSNFKGQWEALAKPITDFLKVLGLSGQAKSEADAQGRGHITGEFVFGGQRNGNIRSKGVGASDGAAGNIPSVGAPNIPIPPQIRSLLPASPQNLLQRNANPARV